MSPPTKAAQNCWRPAPDPDILLTNNAGHKSKRFFKTERADWESTLQANYIPGSNMHLDGGSYPGLV